jgi:ATP-binding cassette subfamily B protein
VVLVLALVMAFLRTASRWVIFGLGRQIEFDLKSDIFKHLLRFEPKFFTKYKAGDLISIMTNDVQAIRGLVGFAVLNLLNTIIAFIIIIPLMYRLNAILTLAFLLLVPLVLVSVTAVSKQIKHYQELVQEKLAEISRFIEENLSAIHIIKSYGQESSEMKRFALQNEGLLAYYLKLVRARTYMGPLMKVIASAGFILLLYFGARAVYQETFTIGDFAAYSLYIERLIWPVATLGWMVTIIYRAKVSGVRIAELFAFQPMILDKPNAIKITTFQTSIKLPYLKNEPEIRANEMLAVVGSIGSGKSTLARKLLRLEDSKRGEILVDGIDITDISLESLRSVISLVPQDSLLFSASIEENILYACEYQDPEHARSLANLVAIDTEIENMPKGYDTLVGERGITLSGGQRQRFTIARALARKPKVLILDDALSSVDDSTAAIIVANIKNLRKGLCTIFITHKLSLAEQMDRTLVIAREGANARS